MDEEILTDFFDWLGRDAVVSGHPAIESNNPRGICDAMLTL